MKKFWPIALMFLCLAVVSSCGKDDDEVVVDEVWKLQNEEAFQAIASDPAYTELKSLGNDGSVYYQVVKEGTGKREIYYTDSVKVYYTGRYYDGEEFDSAEPPYDAPRTFALQAGLANSVIEGWPVAIQDMHVGDRWNIWMPQQLAYGPRGNVNPNTGEVLVPGYSTLNFEIEIVAIIRDGVEYTD